MNTDFKKLALFKTGYPKRYANQDITNVSVNSTSQNSL
jgi:hypothetical protein